MNYCAGAEYKKVDKKLNQIYQEILKHLSNKKKLIYLKNSKIDGLSTEMLIVNFGVLGFMVVLYLQ
ncbi:lysozyme inhibitor LprI family protein [Rickettsia akari]|nr:lysozyme inhibitor LprI family protein [Rickettsia akari]